MPMKIKDITWQLVALAAVIVPSVCGLIYGLVQLGESAGTLAAAVGAVLVAMGYQSSRHSKQIAEVRNDVGRVEKLANGNLARVEASRDMAQQQALALAAKAPPDTIVPVVPVAVPPLVDNRAGHA